MIDKFGNQISPIQSFNPPASDAEAVDITPKVPIFAMRDTVVVPDTSSNLASYQSGLQSNGSTTQAGQGNKVFMIDPQQGIWLGAALFANAPFSVDMQGNLIALAGTFKGTFILGGTLETVSDITLLQAAINAVSAGGGGTVSLIPATYTATSSFTIPSNVTLDGNGSIIDFGGGAYQILIQGTSAYSTGTLSVNYGSTTVTGSGTTWTAAMVGQSILIGDYWYTISARASNTSITLSSTFIGASLAGDTYVIATTVDGASLVNITLQNSSGTLIRYRYCNGIAMDSVTCTNGNQAIDGDDSSGVNWLNSIATNCVIGVTYDNVPFCTIDNSNIFSISGGTGLALTRVSNTAITAISIQGITGVGMSFTNCNDIGLVNFAYQTCSSHGIEFVSGNNDIEAMDGYINSCGGDGIKLTATSDRIVITANSIINNTGWGINIAASSCDNDLVFGNALNNNTAGALTDSGTGTKIRGNKGVSDNIMEGDLALTDITTNDVSTSKHGFVVKAPNDTSKFFRGDATWAAPASTTLTYKNGTTSYVSTTATGNLVIAHGVGVSPKKVKIYATYGHSYSASVNLSCWSHGTYNGTTNSNVRSHLLTGASGSESTSSDNTYTVYIKDQNLAYQRATCTVDATNITLAFTYNATLQGDNIDIMWEAEA